MNLVFELHVLCQHMHVDGCRMSNCLCRLVEPIIGFLPIVDPGLQKVQQDTIIHLLMIHQFQVITGSDHIGPKVIVSLKLEETVLTPPLFNYKGVIVCLALKSPSILATVEDLE